MTAFAGTLAAVVTAVAVLMAVHTVRGLPDAFSPWITRCEAPAVGASGVRAVAAVLGAAVLAVVSWIGASTTPWWLAGTLVSLVLLFVGMLAEPRLHARTEAAGG